MKTRIFTLIVSLFIATMAFAYDAEIDDIYYNLDNENKTAEVTYQYNWSENNYSGVTNITIPSIISYDGTAYSVTSIGDEAFLYCLSLTSITIPNSVTSIGNYAFSYCSSLTSITIPNSVTSIGDYAFANCSSLTSISIPNSVTSIGNEAFYHCSSLTSITIPNSVTSIGNYAFSYCSSLTTIEIPNSVTSIGEDAFSGTPWLNNQPDGCIYINNLLYTYKGEMPENTHIDVKEGTTIIYNNAFSGCSSLTSITIPNSVTSIGEYAFYKCSSLTSITIPNSVTYLGVEAFFYTKWLNNQPDGCIYINNMLYTYKGKMPENTHIDVKEGTTIICNSAFSRCSSLTSITIPNSVTLIDEYAFYECSSLTSITIPNSVTSIGNLAFYDCSSLTSITIPSSVTSIGNSAFYGCTSLTSIEIPNSVTSIGYGAFEECSSLTSIEIPNGVTTIRNRTFYGCTSLLSIIMQSATPPTIGEEAFYEVSRGVEIKVPCGSINSYKTAEYWSEFVNYVENSATLTVISNDNTMGFATVTKRNTCDDDVAQMQAQALPGYKFVRWSDGSTENPHIVLVTEDMTLTAEFAPEGEEPGENPDVEKHNNFIVESADATQGSVIITITAQAIEGFEFSHWSDGSTENPRNVTLDKDVELYAHFQVKGTGLENSVISSANVYSRDGRLHVEGAETDYYVLDMAGRLIYSGRDTELQLPRGVYVVNVGGEVQKVVL